jgi:hypothetical protein
MFFLLTASRVHHIQNGGAMQKNLMHAVSLTPHAKYDTACTIDERFEQPRQPLQGIYIKNINVPELSYPTTTKIYKFKGAT